MNNEYEKINRIWRHPSQLVLWGLLRMWQVADGGLHRMVRTLHRMMCATWSRSRPDTPVTVSSCSAPENSTLLLEEEERSRQETAPQRSLWGNGGSCCERSFAISTTFGFQLPIFLPLINLRKMLKVGGAARSLLGRWIGYTAGSSILAHFRPLTFRSITQRVKERTSKKTGWQWSHNRRLKKVTWTKIETFETRLGDSGCLARKCWPGQVTR